MIVSLTFARAQEADRSSATKLCLGSQNGVLSADGKMMAEPCIRQDRRRN